MTAAIDPTTDTDPTSIHHRIDVDVPVDRAFQVFTQRFDEIKPREHTLMEADIVESVLEPWPGGRLYDRGADGTICAWGRVVAVEAPHRIVFTWDITPQWQIETDPARASEVEIVFRELANDRTSVELEHRHLDRHGLGWEGERDAVDSPQGWPLYLDRYRPLTVIGGV